MPFVRAVSAYECALAQRRGRTGIGSTGYKNYSDALAGHGGRWTVDTLRAYLLDPQGFAPGTAMPNPGLADDDALSDLIEALSRIDTTGDEHIRYN